MAIHINKQHKNTLSKQEKIAIWVTDRIGTFTCAVIFAGIGIGSLIGVITNNTILALAFGAVSSYFLQLVLLPLIMVSQNLTQRHQELLAEETYEAAIKDDINTEEIIKKLDILLERSKRGPHKRKIK